MLATVAASGHPAARTVLLKGLDENGFVFYTNYSSRKGQELAANPVCALVFPWHDLERQVRVEGTAARMPEEENQAYFSSRPRASQVGAWASPQSTVVESRAALDQLYDETAERLAVDYNVAPTDPVPIVRISSGGMIRRTSCVIRSKMAEVSSMRVPVGARACSAIVPLSTSGKKFRPRKGTSARLPKEKARNSVMVLTRIRIARRSSRP